MIDFAGGRGGHQKMSDGSLGNCTPDALVKAAGRYGSTARVPTLWIYAANDSFFSPALARRMFDAYNAAGGHGIYRPGRRIRQQRPWLRRRRGRCGAWEGPMGIPRHLK